MKTLESIAARLRSKFNEHRDLINAIQSGISGRNVGDLFNNQFLLSTSALFPAICISKLDSVLTLNLDIANYPSLVPLLKNDKWMFNNTDIEYSSYTIGTTTTVTLKPANSTLINKPFMEALTELIYSHNEIDRATALTAAHFTALNLSIRFNNSDYKLLGFNSISETLILELNSTGGIPAASTGIIEVYPHRLPANQPNAGTLAQYRKLKNETTFASGSYSGSVENRMGIHRHIDSGHGHTASTPQLGLNGGFGTFTNGGGLFNQVPIEISFGNSSANLGNAVKYLTNPTPNTGKTNRGNLLFSKSYIWAGIYNA